MQAERKQQESYPEIINFCEENRKKIHLDRQENDKKDLTMSDLAVRLFTIILNMAQNISALAVISYGIDRV